MNKMNRTTHIFGDPDLPEVTDVCMDRVYGYMCTKIKL